MVYEFLGNSKLDNLPLFYAQTFIYFYYYTNVIEIAYRHLQTSFETMLPLKQ